MKLLGITAGLILLGMVGMVGMAQATLVTIGTATYSGSDYNLIWDDDNNGNSVIWLDYSNAQSSWSIQNSWATGLDSFLSYNLNPAYSVTWDDSSWRLPDTVNVYLSPLESFNNTSSEMGHLFYTELGNIGYMNTDGTNNPIPPAPDYFLQNVGDFNNLVADWYWSETEYLTSEDRRWLFNMYHGYQGATTADGSQDGYGYGLALRTGQVTVAPVPEPSTILLLGSGLFGLAWYSRKRKKA